MNFTYNLPVNIIFGCGKVNEVGKIAKPYGKKVLIVTGKSSAKKSGLYDKVKNSLEAEGMESVLFDKVTQNPLTTTAIEGAELPKKMAVIQYLPSAAEVLWTALKQLLFWR